MMRVMLAILPPSDISKKIIGFQKEIETKYTAKHAQKVEPHITLIPPFNCDVFDYEKFIEQLKEFVKNKDNQFNIRLDNFQHFNYKTLIVDVAKNDAFESWCKELKFLFNQQKIIKQRVEKHFFVPHITLANKDLKKRDFKLAWQEFSHREFQQNFDLEFLTVMILEDEEWISKNSIKLN